LKRFSSAFLAFQGLFTQIVTHAKEALLSYHLLAQCSC
jgi:hypothetical protein